MIAPKYPMIEYFLLSELNALIALKPVFLPMAISATISVKPKDMASIMYTKRNIPPPYFAAR